MRGEGGRLYCSILLFFVHTTQSIGSAPGKSLYSSRMIYIVYTFRRFALSPELGKIFVEPY